MSKELDALEYGYKELFKVWLRLVEGKIKPTLPLDKKDIIEEKKDFTKTYNLIEKSLKEYERYKPLIDNIQNGLTETISVEDLKVLVKRSKALEVIKKKRVNVDRLLKCDSALQYNYGMSRENRMLADEEFDLFKEVLV